MSTPSDERRRARAAWSLRVVRPDAQEEAAEADALFWDAIPVDERAEAVWQASEELWQIAHPEGDDERRLSRLVARIVRR